ncbi:hypothetical protein C9J03_21025 [Photobacterium gaetbulicola]|uniref:Uncharacterized protein n=1 Tax=Photobacterium gaetbulicola Gung47 TaxID=658445 RepID=A0A0C5WXM5_9GAMM|nr:hypothetical protein [Photobacterium gaetbulicola]AJR07815.1 hypothetical protein H744_2c1128 [Photobacterium gaetbulicola Gung47]PSU03390.1 hypothetical protein C9J03_21025 [Photobacterium gaetbulicola]
MEQVSHLYAFNHFVIAIAALTIMVLVARTLVAGTKYSSLLVIVVFGLALGSLLVHSDMATPGLEQFPVVALIGQTTVIALIASFFVGGQEIRRLLSKKDFDEECDFFSPSSQEVVLGTSSTQLTYIIRAFLLLIGIQTADVLISDRTTDFALGDSFLLLSYICLALAFILVDRKAVISNKGQYIRKGLFEVVAIIVVLNTSLWLSNVVSSVIGLPQIFFAMILSSGLGAVLPKWKHGPTMNALLFAGIPLVLAGSFLVGGSHMVEAFGIPGLQSVIVYGFSGQIFWMFGGLALLIFVGKSNHIRNLAPGLAGGLSHSGLTGACTAGDFGRTAASRAPIMINIPFAGHIFVFTILAASAERGSLMVGWTLPLLLAGTTFVFLALKSLRAANGCEKTEVKGLMLFSLGWQIMAVFGSFTLLSVAGMSLEHASMSAASGLSHFGLFAAVQEGMFGSAAASLITFTFAMTFLVHPFVFAMFGKAAESNGKMAEKAVTALASAGLIGVVSSTLMI